MVLYGLLCSLGIRGGLILGMTATEILTSYWISRHNPAPPPKIYFLNRRIHHGELGTLLALSSLFLRASSIPSGALGILAGIGFGLLKDDYADIGDWFRLKKEKEDKKQTTVNATSPIYENERTTTTRIHEERNGNNSEEVTIGISRSSIICPEGWKALREQYS